MDFFTGNLSYFGRVKWAFMFGMDFYVSAVNQWFNLDLKLKSTPLFIKASKGLNIKNKKSLRPEGFEMSDGISQSVLTF